MTEFFSTLAGLLLKGGIVLLAANEIRGLILAAPVLYGMYAAGGTVMAVWIGFCSIMGILISIAPLFVIKKFNLLPVRSSPNDRGSRNSRASSSSSRA